MSEWCPPPSFSIPNGTCQGCPLSPFIFVLVLEPFLRNICVNPYIAGIFCGTQEHKISAYADDLLFFLIKSIATLPILLQEFKQCGALSNFHINYQKSEALNLTIPNQALCNIQANLNGLHLILNILLFYYLKTYLHYICLIFLHFYPSFALNYYLDHLTIFLDRQV